MSAAGGGRAIVVLFWGAVASIAYTYVGFPLVLLWRSVVLHRPHRCEDVQPAVSLVIAAHNEAGDIARKLDNLLALDYGHDRLQVIIASDGSDDGTDDIVAGYRDRGVRLLSLPRVGKAGALNAAIAVADGDILVFSDANSMYAPDALRALVRPFADPSVGGVAGDQRYLRGVGTDGIAAGEQRYWDLDRLLKVAGSRAGNTISATGAIYAVRRELCEPIPDGVTDDFFTSTGVIARGRRLVFARDAAAYEPVAPSGTIEFGRKVRVMTRGLRGVVLRRALLDPRRSGFYAVQLLSHKVLRRLMAVPLLVLAAASPALWRRGRLYRAMTLGQGAFYTSAVAGLLLPRGRRILVLKIPAYFCLVNAASLSAVWNILRGRRIDRWEPER